MLGLNYPEIAVNDSSFLGRMKSDQPKTPSQKMKMRGSLKQSLKAPHYKYLLAVYFMFCNSYIILNSF